MGQERLRRVPEKPAWDRCPGLAHLGLVHLLLQPDGQAVVWKATLEFGEQLVGLGGPSLPLQLGEAVEPFLGRLLVEAVPDRQPLSGGRLLGLHASCHWLSLRDFGRGSGSRVALGSKSWGTLCSFPRGGAPLGCALGVLE
jgi:hypothetical protein